MNASIRRLAIGTAQLGMNYGIANRTGKPSRLVSFAILDAARAVGIAALDTAEGYGDAETLIGDYRADRGNTSFEVYTKIDAGAAPWDVERFCGRVAESNRRMRAVSHGLLAHGRCSMADWTSGMGACFAAARARGLTHTIGISVYDVEDFERAIDRADIDVIQAPFNAVDRRLLERGLLARAACANKIVFLRSAFLQGLLLCDSNDIPARLEFARPTVAAWQSACREIRIPQVLAALAYVKDAAPDANIIVGCETLEQLRDNIAMWRDAHLAADQRRTIEGLAVPEERVVNPSLWPL